MGYLTISETLAQEQRIERTKEHLAHVDKDCFYLQLPVTGAIGLRQGKTEVLTNSACGAFYSASDPYELYCSKESKSIFIEINRDDVENHFGHTAEANYAFSTSVGSGALFSSFVLSVVAENEYLSQNRHHEICNSIIGLLSMAINESQEYKFKAESETVQQAKTRAIKHFIKLNVTNSNLSPAYIAKHNSISLRYLHYLFSQEERSVMDYVWQQRLRYGHAELLRNGAEKTIFQIAFNSGFNSSSHFSSSFRREFGLRPKDVIN